MDVIDDARRRGDEIEVELALQSFAHDLKMQETKEATAKSKAERSGGFHLIGEAGIVQVQLAERLAQVFEERRIDRKEAAEHHLLRRLEAGERTRRALFLVGDGVADLRVGNLLDLRRQEADFARSENVGRLLLGCENADPPDL